MDEPVTERQVAAQAAATDEKTLNLSISDHPPELGKILLFQVCRPRRFHQAFEESIRFSDSDISFFISTNFSFHVLSSE